MMLAESNGKTNFSSIEWLLTEAVTKHKEGEIAEAIAFYLEAIELDESQPAWVYGNVITLMAQIDRLNEGLELGEKALKIHPKADEIYRAIGILFHRRNDLSKAQEFYIKSIEYNSEQPEWLYTHAINIFVKAEDYERASKLQQKANEKFPESECLGQLLNLESLRAEKNLFKHISYVDFDSKSLFKVSEPRETPQDMENLVDLDIASIRRQLMDSAIIEQYQTILEQILFDCKQGEKEMDYEALVHCLAEIKTDIHYLKTKLSHSDPETLDPQAKNNLDLDKIISLPRPVPIKCELKKRIVGSGWHEVEEHGRWTGPGTLSSVVLPYPVAGKYKFEMVVQAEAKADLLQTLKININDQALEISVIQRTNNSFPVIVQGEVLVSLEKAQSFLIVDLTVDETAVPLKTDSRSIGLLVERVSLIPIYTTIN